MRRFLLPFTLSLAVVLASALPAAALHVTIEIQSNIVTVTEADPLAPITLSVYNPNGVLKATATQQPDSDTGVCVFFLADWSPEARFPALVGDNRVVVEQLDVEYEHTLPTLKVKTLDSTNNVIAGVLRPRVVEALNITISQLSMQHGLTFMTGAARVKADETFQVGYAEIGNLKCNDNVTLGYDYGDFSVVTNATVPGLFVMKDTELAFLRAREYTRFQAQLLKTRKGPVIADSITEPLKWLDAGVVQMVAPSGKPIPMRAGNRIAVTGSLDTSWKTKVPALDAVVGTFTTGTIGDPPEPYSYVDITATAAAGKVVAFLVLYDYEYYDTVSLITVTGSGQTFAVGLTDELTGEFVYRLGSDVVGAPYPLDDLSVSTVLAITQNADGNYFASVVGHLPLVGEMLTELLGTILGLVGGVTLP